MIWKDPPKGFGVSRHMEKIKSIQREFLIYDEAVMSTALFEDMLVTIATKRRYTNTVMLRDRLPVVLPQNKETIDKRALMRLGMFLLEHHADLRRSKITAGWNGSPRIWVAGIVSDVCKEVGRKPGMAMRYALRVVVLTGPPAGQIFTSSVSTRYAAYLPKMLGVSTRTDKRVMPMDSIGMYLLGNYGTARKKPLSLLEVKASAAMKTKNKKLFNGRHS